MTNLTERVIYGSVEEVAIAEAICTAQKYMVFLDRSQILKKISKRRVANSLKSVVL